MVLNNCIPMKPNFSLLLTVAALLATTAATRANQLITFDDVADGTYLTSYAGFSWDNFYVVAGNDLGGSGYQNGTVSQPNVAYNGYGEDADFYTADLSTFTLGSAYFTAAWNNGLTVDVTGLFNGSTVDTTSFVVNTTGPTLEVFNFAGINEVEFSASGGTNAGLGGSGTHFAMDNLVIGQVTSVPDAASALGLMSLGFAALGALRRKRG